MGMGDIKKPRLQYRSLRCGRCGLLLPEISVRRCPHPAVLTRYGQGKSVKMCIYCCSKCSFSKRDGLNPGLGCSYKDA